MVLIREQMDNHTLFKKLPFQLFITAAIIHPPLMFYFLLHQRMKIEDALIPLTFAEGSFLIACVRSNENRRVLKVYLSQVPNLKNRITTAFNRFILPDDTKALVQDLLQ